MAAYRCSLHGISFPAPNIFGPVRCPVTGCTDQPTFFSDLDPDKDWKDKANYANTDLEFPDSTAKMIYTWRFGELWRAGYDSVTAELLALGDYDLHKMVDAKKAGCTDSLALATFL
jgi:hypothetical protein